MTAIFVWTLNDIGLLVVLAVLVLAGVVAALLTLAYAIRDAVAHCWRWVTGRCRHG